LTVSAFFFKEWRLADGGFKKDISLNDVTVEQSARALGALVSIRQTAGGEVVKALGQAKDQFKR